MALHVKIWTREETSVGEDPDIEIKYDGSDREFLDDLANKRIGSELRPMQRVTLCNKMRARIRGEKYPR